MTQEKSIIDMLIRDADAKASLAYYQHQETGKTYYYRKYERAEALRDTLVKGKDAQVISQTNDTLKTQIAVMRKIVTEIETEPEHIEYLQKRLIDEIKEAAAAAGIETDERNIETIGKIILRNYGKK